MLFRTILIAAVLALTSIAHARAPIPGEPASAARAAPDEGRLLEHGHYTNKRGQSVHSPAHTTDGKAPEGASAQCRDGTYSFSRSHRGTCSRHGGVASWL